MSKRCLLALVALMAALPVRAEVSLYDRVQLVVALKSESPCCVVDGRSEAQRRKQPLKDALVWSESLRINPTSAVVVIASQDAAAVSIGKKLETRFAAKKVMAVKGGYATWNAIVSASEGTSMPPTFVIPSNTCEQGKPLQTLRSQKR